jgi:hypothetical protein
MSLSTYLYSVHRTYKPTRQQTEHVLRKTVRGIRRITPTRENFSHETGRQNVRWLLEAFHLAVENGAGTAPYPVQAHLQGDCAIKITAPNCGLCQSTRVTRLCRTGKRFDSTAVFLAILGTFSFKFSKT